MRYKTLVKKVETYMNRELTTNEENVLDSLIHNTNINMDKITEIKKERLNKKLEKINEMKEALENEMSTLWNNIRTNTRM